MGKTRSVYFVSITITPEELLILSQYTNIAKLLLKLIIQPIDKAKQKKKIVKRVKVNLERKELDKLILAIVSKANKKIRTKKHKNHWKICLVGFQKNTISLFPIKKCFELAECLILIISSHLTPIFHRTTLDFFLKIPNSKLQLKY